jgi:tryptophanyl-tRNA synthetase
VPSFDIILSGREMHVARKYAFARSLRPISQPTRCQSTTASAATEEYRRRSGKPLRDTIFSGIQPTGIPHLGNYLGALRQWKDLQDDRQRKQHQCFFSIVDLHALTLRQDPRTLLQRRRETLAALLAIGLSPDKSVIFVQSEVRRNWGKI